MENPTRIPCESTRHFIASDHRHPNMTARTHRTSHQSVHASPFTDLASPLRPRLAPASAGAE
eukprot:42485-Eustigmatos_ZCMA.PRE.1